MVRKIKILGVSLIALAATVAASAPAAQAGSFDLGAQPAVITGGLESGQTLYALQLTNGQQVSAKCGFTTLEGTVTGQAVNELTLTPTYSGCSFLGLSAQVQMNGCKYTLTGAGQPANTALVDITGCTAATPYIQIQTVICQLRIPAQTALSHVVASTLAPGGGLPHQITLATTATGATAQQIGVGCPNGNLHQSNSLAFTSNLVFKAFQDAGSTQVTKHNHQYNEVKAGAQVSFTAT